MKRDLCLEIVRGATSYTIGIEEEQGIIGRGPNADIRLPFSTISSAHIEFKSEGQQFFFRDLGSTNGTVIDGEKIVPNQWLEIETEIVLTIVDTELIFTTRPGRTPQFTMVQSGTLARKLLMEVLASKEEAEEDAFLEALTGPDKGKRLSLHDGIQHMEIGGATGHFNFPPMTASVVATLIQDGDGFSILPKETIFIDGIPTTASFRLCDAAEIEMGKRRFKFRDPLEAYFSEIDDVAVAEDVASLELPKEVEALAPSPKIKIEEPAAELNRPISENKKTSKKKDWFLIVVILMVTLVGCAVVIGVLSL